MNKITIDKNSLSYRLATVYGDMDGYFKYADDICTFRRYVLKGLFMTLVFTAFVTFLSLILLSPIFYGILYLIYGYWQWTELSMAGTVIWASIMIIFFIGICMVSFTNSNMKEKISESVPGQMYKSFKDKVCVQVEFK